MRPRKVSPQLQSTPPQSAQRNPVFRAGAKILRSNSQLSSLFKAFNEQLRQSGALNTVPRVEGLTATDFYRTYYFGNRPVILTGLMKGWKALRLWDPDYFARD